MSPYEHGEVYVLDDGGEADLDLGNYERFLETRLTRDHNITTGKVRQGHRAKAEKREESGLCNSSAYCGTARRTSHLLVASMCGAFQVYAAVIARERRGDYLGKTVQVIPHITDCIQNWIERVAKIPVDPAFPGIEPDVCMIEFGGTVVRDRRSRHDQRAERRDASARVLTRLCSWQLCVMSG